MNRGLRNIDFAAYGQDEWRVTPRLTLNYGLRWEVSTPFVDIRNRMNSWSPGMQSTVYPECAEGAAVPGRPGRAGRHRAGVLEGPDAARRVLPGIRPGPAKPRSARLTESYYDSFTNGVGGPLQAPLSALPWTQARQLPPPINFTDPWNGQEPVPAGFLSSADHCADHRERHAPAVLAELEFLRAAGAGPSVICWTCATSATRARGCRE